MRRLKTLTQADATAVQSDDDRARQGGRHDEPDRRGNPSKGERGKARPAGTGWIA